MTKKSQQVLYDILEYSVTAFQNIAHCFAYTPLNDYRLYRKFGEGNLEIILVRYLIMVYSYL